MYDCCRMGVVESRLPLRHRLSHRREGESRGSRPEGKRLCRLGGISFRHGTAMELRHLRYFLAVVEEGSLTTAAELRLHTSQPSLSRQIRDLEYQVGAAVEAARRAAQPAKKTFAIGFQTGHEMNWLPRAMHVLRDELKNIDITVSSDYSPDLAEALLRGRLDVALLRVEPTFDLGYEVVDHEPLIVLMPSDHRLISREAIHPREFVGEIFIGGSNKATVLRAATEDYLRRCGLDIKLDHGVDNMAMAMSLV